MIIEIPVDCPKTYSYLIYKKFGGNDEYFDYIRKAGVIKTKEPALAGGRYDEKCILLELDNRRIIVIPIDECEKFLELLIDIFINTMNCIRKTRKKSKRFESFYNSLISFSDINKIIDGGFYEI